mmetsp:Transcript_31943/g.61746  ORF Transcript_31943/g.61746 Transcript_31943/m.61746 type:complete len:109 (+) Transcript_31943:1-327(+)
MVLKQMLRHPRDGCQLRTKSMAMYWMIPLLLLHLVLAVILQGCSSCDEKAASKCGEGLQVTCDGIMQMEKCVSDLNCCDFEKKAGTKTKDEFQTLAAFHGCNASRACS